MDADFARRFLAARDKDFSPHESWRQRRGNYPNNEVALWFVQPLEYLGQTDFESILLAAAESGALTLDARFRYSCPGRDAPLLMLRYLEAYLLPLMKRKAIRCGPCSALETIGKEGVLFINLYSREDTPPEYRDRLISRDEFEEMIRPYDGRQINLPPRRDN